jgi:hypothetical protein
METAHLYETSEQTDGPERCCNSNAIFFSTFAVNTWKHIINA